MPGKAQWFTAAALACVLVPLAGQAAPGKEADAEYFAGSSVPLAEIERAIARNETIGFKPVGTTSVVFKMRLAGAIDAAFKPQTRTHPQGDLAEVAAYRIGRYLGMRNVAPAVPRVLAMQALHRGIPVETAPQWDELKAQIVASDAGNVRGVAIYWVPNMRELGIDTDRGMRKWARWLSQVGAPPYRDKSKLLARQISEMIVLDYLIGNWDRFSGANAQGDRSGRNLLVRDHNVAFYSPLPAPQHRRIVNRLRKVQRFSASAVERLKGLDAAALEKLLQRPNDPSGYTALSPRQRREVLQRRQTVLSYVAALIDEYGQSRVLFFP